MIRRPVWYLIGLGVGVGLVYGGIFYWHNFRGVGPALKRPPVKIATVINTTGMPLKLPPGWKISIFAENLPGVRVMAFGPDGDLWVSQPGAGQVTQLTVKEGRVTHQIPVWQHLDRPHGLAFDPSNPSVLYVAEESKVEKFLIDSEAGPQLVKTLPPGGEHVTRTIGFGPDGKLYVAIGSTCNACKEKDSHRAAISTMNKDGTAYKVFASGLRNSVFFVWHGGQLWATDNGRDYLGDNLPPDDVNVIAAGDDYGWPYCYGHQVQDTSVDRSSAAAARCRASVPSTIELPAHSAPLGLDFVPDTNDWPADWRGNLIVAFHGSWNRTKPTGYKLVRVPFSSSGQPKPAEDFITGWLTGQGAIGRPVDVVFHDQSLYVSDDKAGVIYKITYQGQQVVSTDCRATGCSGQICSDHDVISTCEFKPAYACYGSADCGRIADGTCGWQVTPELTQCLLKANTTGR